MTVDLGNSCLLVNASVSDAADVSLCGASWLISHHFSRQQYFLKVSAFQKLASSECKIYSSSRTKKILPDHVCVAMRWMYVKSSFAKVHVLLTGRDFSGTYSLSGTDIPQAKLLR